MTRARPLTYFHTTCFSSWLCSAFHFLHDGATPKCGWLKYLCWFRVLAEGQFMYNPCVSYRLLAETKEAEHAPAEENKGFMKYLLLVSWIVKNYKTAPAVKPEAGYSSAACLVCYVAASTDTSDSCTLFLLGSFYQLLEMFLQVHSQNVLKIKVR